MFFPVRFVLEDAAAFQRIGIGRIEGIGAFMAHLVFPVDLFDADAF